MITQWHTGGNYQGTTIYQNDYTYDHNGNRLENTITTASGSRTEDYTYDDLNRLKTVDYDDGETQSYGYDAMGNRGSISKTVGGTTINESDTFDTVNRMTNRNIGGTNYAYSFDANGNLLSGGANSDMKWDAQNRMVGCTLAGNPNIVSTYTYGADGLRRSMTVGTVTTNYILDGQSVVRETTTDGKTRTYLNGPRGSEFCLETTSTGSKLRYYVYDGHGNVVGEADATGKIVDSTGTEKTFRNYDVWGAVRNSTEAGQSLSKNKYCGSLGHTSEPDTGLIYMRARYYDPAIGRFISEDSAKDGGNWYAYAGNNPVGMVDADGHASFFDVYQADLAAGGVMVAIGYYLVKRTEYATAGYILGAGGVALGGVGAVIAIKMAQDKYGPIFKEYGDKILRELSQGICEDMEGKAQQHAQELTQGVLDVIYGQQFIMAGAMQEWGL